MDIQKELINTIELMINKTMERKSESSIVPSVVRDVDIDSDGNNRYLIVVNGIEVWAKKGTNLSLSVGTPVWACIPQGNIGDSFILAYK